MSESGNNLLVNVESGSKIFHRGSEKFGVLESESQSAQRRVSRFDGAVRFQQARVAQFNRRAGPPDPWDRQHRGRSCGPIVRSPLSHWRARHIGFVFQLYNLLPVLTAKQSGTDYPGFLYDPVELKDKLLGVNEEARRLGTPEIPREKLDGILGDNFARILGILRPARPSQRGADVPRRTVVELVETTFGVVISTSSIIGWLVERCRAAVEPLCASGCRARRGLEQPPAGRTARWSSLSRPRLGS